jgi:hypothetical protein
MVPSAELVEAVKRNAAYQVHLFKQLTDEQQETFMGLLPGWYGTIEDLIEVSRAL